MALLSRLHLTYLLREIRERFRKAPEELDEGVTVPLGESLARHDMRVQQRARSHDETADRIQAEWHDQNESERTRYYEALLLAIEEQWRGEVEASGARFYLLLLPREDEHLAEGRLSGGALVIDLWNEFQPYGDPARFFFGRDGHWNELGNLFAAVHLYQHLAPDLGLEALPRERIEEALYAYYRAFSGWMPPSGVHETPVDDEELQRIRDRYAALALDRSKP
jgi:hypothetical protein